MKKREHVPTIRPTVTKKTLVWGAIIILPSQQNLFLPGNISHFLVLWVILIHTWDIFSKYQNLQNNVPNLRGIYYPTIHHNLSVQYSEPMNIHKSSALQLKVQTCNNYLILFKLNSLRLKINPFNHGRPKINIY